ncbi:MAG: PfkB family carbohydrate kinase [Bacillota bacterium]|nr:PfkB family carbohydrate kinase [Bacillota bacterium]
MQRILNQASGLKIMVIGDFFLDSYLLIDPTKEELSRETGKTAHQVVGSRLTPGAAGNVAKNLRTLGVKDVVAVGALGLDGYGYELRKSLRGLGVDIGHLLECSNRITPTYIKPVIGLESQEELNRLDLKNWTPTPQRLEDEIIGILRDIGPECDAVMVVDQVEEENCGVITDNVRAALQELGRAYPGLFILVDSRRHIGRFSDVIIKPNQFEAARALGKKSALDDPEQSIQALFAMTGKPVFMTCGDAGQWVYDGEQSILVPAVPVKGPIDIVGAGDSASAGILIALASGASCLDAAFLGNLVASVTIRQLGTTGEASQEDVLELFDGWTSQGLTL